MCDSNAKFPFTKTSCITVTNEGDEMLDLEILINETELFQSSSFDIVVAPMTFKLERGESMRINVMCNCYKPLMSSIEILFSLEVKKKLKKKSKESPEYKKIKCAIGCKVVPIQKNVSLKLQRDNGVIDSLSSYLPNFVKRHIKSRLQFIPNGEPFSQKLSASILFIDISGFTSLNEQLAKLGPAGPEAVSKHINNYFSKIIDVVHKFGGDILKFAGKQFFIFLTFFF